MGCCSDDEPMAQETIPAIKEERSCTDILFLILYVAFLGVIIYSSSWGYMKGSLRNIARPYDVDSNACGVGKLKDYPYLFFTERISNWKDVKGTVCVKECLKKQGPIQCHPNSAVPDCSKINWYPTSTWIRRFCIVDFFNSENLKKVNAVTGVLVAGASATGKVVTETAKTWNKEILGAIKIGNFDTWIEDITESWWVILICFGIAMVFGLLYVWLVKVCARCIIYTFIFLFYATIIGLGFLCFFYAGDVLKKINMHETIDAQWFKWTGIGLWIVAGVLLVVLCCTCARLEIAIAMLQVGADFVMENVCLVFTPLIYSIGFVGFLMWWASGTAYIWSIGTVTHNKGTAFGTIEWDTMTTAFVWLNLVSFFWHSAIFLCSCNFLITTCCTIWYFSANKSTSGALGKSINWMFLYHWGSIAFSAFIIGTTWVFQLFVQMLIYFLKTEDKAGENQCAICLAQCCACCLECIESCIKFISKQAYVEIAIRSCSFCTGACKSMGIAASHAMEYSLIHGAVECTSVFAVFTITVGTTVIGAVLLDNVEEAALMDVESVAPKVFIFLMALVISKMFTFLYDLACDTVIHCYIYNEEMAPESFEGARDKISEHRYDKMGDGVDVEMAHHGY